MALIMGLVSCTTFPCDFNFCNGIYASETMNLVNGLAISQSKSRLALTHLYCTASASQQPSSITKQTLLHTAAGNGQVDIVNYLLDCSPSLKVDLNARTVSGETPLHMAAKNGCSEAAKLLLDRGAYIDAKNKKGMTPLHLAVWHSITSEDVSIVQTLLDNNANCREKDYKGRTALDHIPQGPENEKLRKLLSCFLKAKRKKKALEEFGTTKDKMDGFEEEYLSKIVGLNDLKTQLKKWAKGMLLDERRRAFGLNIGSRRTPHMAFLGNPGTGKTSVARVLGKLLYTVGILPTDKVIEVQRTDLVDGYVGHTGPKTRKKIEEAEGGILFVDEAYRLIQTKRDSKSYDFGIEALEEIMSVMETGKIVVIFAGYSEPMKRVIASNPGFSRRITKIFNFDDFSAEEIAQIVHIKMNNQIKNKTILYGFKLHESCTVNEIASLIKKETTEKKRNEMNGGLADILLVNAKENLDQRLSFECLDNEEMCTIKLEDLEAGLRVFSKNSKL
ncbi:unnamed protein product [Cochlearia groenlandica]